MDEAKDPKINPAVFRAILLVDRDGVPTPYAKIQTAWQRADNEALDPAWRFIAGKTNQEASLKRLFSERPRGASKSTDLGVAVLWVLFAAERRVNGAGFAADKDQARLLIDTISHIVSLNSWLAPFIEVQRDCVRNPKTGSEFVVIASDAGSSFGITPDFIIADEFSHWPEGRGEAMWESIVSSAAKRKHCVFVCITNAGWRASWQFPIREAIRLDPRWRFSRLESPPEWIDEQRLEEQRRLLTDESYRRLWLNQWVEGVGNGISVAALEECCCRTGPVYCLPQESRVECVGAVDLGLRRDHAAFVIAMPDPVRGRIVLAHEQSWNPADFGGEIPLSLVKDAIIEARPKYGPLDNVVIDEWNAGQLIQDLRAAGFNVIVRQTTSRELSGEATTLTELVNERILELFPGMTYDDLGKVRIVERPTGFKLEWPRDGQGHCDRGAALASCLPYARTLLAMLEELDFENPWPPSQPQENSCGQNVVRRPSFETRPAFAGDTNWWRR